MASFKNCVVTNGPNEQITENVISFHSKYQKGEDDFIYGIEKVHFHYLKPKNGFQLIEASPLEVPEDSDDDFHFYEEFQSMFLLTIQADADIYDLSNIKNQQYCIEQFVRWIVPDASYNYKLKIIDHKELSTVNGYHNISVTLLCDYFSMSEEIGGISYSPFYQDVWDPHMEQIIKEGVCYSDEIVPSELCESLRKNIGYLAENTMVDFHPNSNDIVRDLVHPALYSYVKGVSKVVTNICQIIPPSRDDQDFWGRPYEDSKFQWLPTPFNISKNGKCTIENYVNNLDREKFPNLYNDLESLFQVFLPYFEEVWAYAKAMQFNMGEYERDEVKEFEKIPISLKERELLVIPKIVEYTLQPGQSYEGVWHAEGMSHENIVMTGIYFIDRDSDINGGDLKFKRNCTQLEQNKFRENFHSDSTLHVVQDFLNGGFIPLGRFPTDEGYGLVFPNCHIHKISKMINVSISKAARRRIVVFFVTNPEKITISTRDVPPQQQDIPLEDAKKYRLELMSERKYNKDKLNIRPVELCEH